MLKRNKAGTQRRAGGTFAIVASRLKNRLASTAVSG
jgi:hypothetical protein